MAALDKKLYYFVTSYYWDTNSLQKMVFFGLGSGFCGQQLATSTCWHFVLKISSHVASSVGLNFLHNKLDDSGTDIWPLSDKSGVCLGGRRGAVWSTERLDKGLVLVWRRALRWRWDGSVWRGCRGMDKDGETFTFDLWERPFVQPFVSINYIDPMYFF